MPLIVQLTPSPELQLHFERKISCPGFASQYVYRQRDTHDADLRHPQPISLGPSRARWRIFPLLRADLHILLRRHVARAVCSGSQHFGLHRSGQEHRFEDASGGAVYFLDARNVLFAGCSEGPWFDYDIEFGV